MSIEKMREEFEAWYVKKFELDEDQAGENLVRFPDDRTKYWPHAQTLWEAWQASRAAIEVELPPEFCDGRITWTSAMRAIEASGLKVKA